MLKLTIFCQADQTDVVVTALHDHPQVRNVVRLPAIEVETGRDVVTAFLDDEAADDVLAHLRALCDWQAGDLSLMNVDLFVRNDLAQLDTAEDDEEAGGTIGSEMILVRAQAEPASPGST
ncbi:hypothetical protein ACFLYD_04850 [Chloroflexota bacterium]